jgi:hypothetical protein
VAPYLTVRSLVSRTLSRTNSNAVSAAFGWTKHVNTQCSGTACQADRYWTVPTKTPPVDLKGFGPSRRALRQTSVAYWRSRSRATSVLWTGAPLSCAFWRRFCRVRRVQSSMPKAGVSSRRCPGNNQSESVTFSSRSFRLLEGLSRLGGDCEFRAREAR